MGINQDQEYLIQEWASKVNVDSMGTDDNELHT